jgi:hypothetical protein
MKRSISSIIAILLAALILYLGYQVYKGPTIINTVDTVQTVHRDTIYQTITDTIYTNVPSQPDTIVIWDTLRVPTSDIPSRLVTTSISDSLISGSITTKVRGVIDSQSLQYKLNYPLITIDRNTLIRRTRTIQPSSYIAAGVGLSNLREQPMNIRFSAMYTTANRTSFLYQYNISQDTHGVSILFPIIGR